MHAYTLTFHEMKMNLLSPVIQACIKFNSKVFHLLLFSPSILFHLGKCTPVLNSISTLQHICIF